MVPASSAGGAWAAPGEAIAAALIRSNQAFCSPAVTALQFHGVVFGLLLGTLWFLSGWVRLQELRRLRRAADDRGRRRQGQQQRDGAPADAGDEEAPSVTIVLPTRGCRAHSMDNWRAILGLDYGAAPDAVLCSPCAAHLPTPFQKAAAMPPVRAHVYTPGC
jgi:hypothetical protein